MTKNWKIDTTGSFTPISSFYDVHQWGNEIELPFGESNLAIQDSKKKK